MTPLKKANYSHKRPRVLALFSGAGGLDLGFQLAGFDVHVSTDIESLFLQSIALNNGRYFSEHHKVICADISTLEPQMLGDGPFDFMIGGPPCQSFSAAGRRAGGVHGINDFRGSLFWHYRRLIEHFQPRGFLFENVRGLLQANKGRDWLIIRDSFASLGYTMNYRLLDAADYGVPQHRERLIVVGLRDGSFLFPRPTHGPDSSTRQPHVGVGQAFADIDDPTEIVPPYGGKWGNLLKEIPPGMNYLFFTEEMGHSKPQFAWRSRFSDFLYKIDPSVPTKTVVASQGRYGGPFHWRGRKLTLLEYKRLFTFPDDYEFAGTYLLSVKQIGNSVAPKFAQALASAVLSQAFKKPLGDIKLMADDFLLSFDRRKGGKAIRTRALRRKSSALSYLGPLFESVSKPSLNKSVSVKEYWEYASPRERIISSVKNTSTHRYKVSGRVKDGKWTILATKLRSNKTANAILDLHFQPSSTRLLDAIHVSLKTDNLSDIGIAWDVVDYCIKNSSSYNSIHPLYGHFTEPHPKFTLEIDATDINNPSLAKFIMATSRFDYCSRIRPLKELISWFPNKKPNDTVQWLRSIGFDIRVHETNRTIPRGHFRVCYPFTNSLDDPKFVVWREVGTHRTADDTSIPA